MPLYEYQCHQCGKIFEVIQKFSDTPLAVHEGCGGALERLLSAAALQFKGTGWYVTDYARKGRSPSTSPTNGKSETKSETTSETKTEAKAETRGETKTEAKDASKSAGKSDSK